MKNKQILVDVDDTLLLFADTLQQFIGDEYGLYSDKRLKDHHNIQKLFGVDMPTLLELVEKIHRSKLMETVPAMECASVVLPELHREGFKFVAITACLNDKETLRMRRKNLEDVFGFEWDDIHCVGMVNSKKDALKLYEPSFWVDDLYHHTEAGFECGHKSFLIDKPYNRDNDHPEITRVKDWYDIAEIIR